MNRPDAAAWETAHAVAHTLVEAEPDRMRAVYAVGALVHGGYRAERSPIELVVVVRGADVEDDDEREVMRARHAHPGDRILAAMLCESDLQPPYAPEREVAPEVARLLDEGVRLAGIDVHAAAQRPSRDDLVAYMAHVHGLIRHTLLRRDEDEIPSDLETLGLATMACRHQLFLDDEILIWRPLDVLTAFTMRHPDHPDAPCVRAVIEATRTDRRPGPRLHRAVRRLWTRVHEEIRA